MDRFLIHKIKCIIISNLIKNNTLILKPFSMLIDLIAGALTNFIKISPIINAIKEIKSKSNVNFRLVHTGQHYDKNMSLNFFINWKYQCQILI